MQNNIKNIAEKIHDKAIECGYDGCGIISLGDMDGYKKYLDDRIKKIPDEKGKKLYGFYDAFTNLDKLYPWAKSVIICTFYLGQYKYPKSLQGKYAKSFMLLPDTIPECPEYKNAKLFEKWLTEQGVKFTCGGENSAASVLPLRHAAVYAGLGIFRKNNFFYGEKGSYYSLKGFLIDVDCEYKNKCEIKPCPDNCNLCQEACKTKALFAPYTMNPALCISFLTTFGGGAVPENLNERDLGTWICGCDDCQDACPHNKIHDWNVGKEFYGLNEIEDLLKPENIINASDEVLIDKVIPRTDFHIPPEQCDTLRICAKRVIRMLK